MRFRHIAIIAAFVAAQPAFACISCVQKNIIAVMNEVALHATHLPAVTAIHTAPTPSLKKHDQAPQQRAVGASERAPVVATTQATGTQRNRKTTPATK